MHGKSTSASSLSPVCLKKTLDFHFIFLILSYLFVQLVFLNSFLDISLPICCLDNCRSSYHESSVIKGFHSFFQTWRAGLPTAVTRRSPALLLPAMCNSDAATLIGQPRRRLAPTQTPASFVKLVPYIRPRHLCQTVTKETPTDCQKCCHALTINGCFVNQHQNNEKLQ